MKILEVRDGFIKFETSKEFALSTFLQVKGIEKCYIAQVIQVKHAGENYIVYAKFINLYNGILAPYDKTLPSVDSEVSEFSFEELSKSFSVKNPITVGLFADKTSEISFDKDDFDKKTLISLDSPELTEILLKSFANKFEKHIIIDTLGVFEGKKYIAGVDFKLPLNTDSLEFMFEDCLSDATSDSKNLIKDIFQDLADYSKTVPFVPFGALKIIVDDMVNKSHVFKLLVLKNKLAKFDKLGYFAATANEAENLNKILADNVVIDLSKLDATFLNRYLSVIYSALEKNQQKPKIFVIASNALNKKILKKLLMGSLQVTFATHSRFKYINEIKPLFDNLIIEPTFVNRDNFKTYSTIINSMDKETMLVISKNFDNIPLIMTVKTEEPEVIEIDVNNSTLTEEEALELEEALENVDPAVEAISKKSDDLIEKVANEINSNTTSEELALFTEDTDEDNEENTAEDIKEEISEIETNIEDEYEDIESNEHSETLLEEAVETDKEENYNISETEIQEEDIDEQTEIIALDSAPEESTENDIEEYHTQVDEFQTIEIPEDISTLAEEAETEFLQNEMDILEDTDTDSDAGSEINTDSDVTEQMEETSNESEVIEVMQLEDNNEEDFGMIVELDENEIPEDAIVVDFEDEEIQSENDSLEREIIEDVDKVFTTIKEDSISDSDLDFIDELNGEMDSDSENYTLPEGMEELTELEEAEEDENDNFLEPLEEVNDFSPQDSKDEKEILETRNSSTPIVPVYEAEIPAEDLVFSDAIEQGDTVVHAKYGNGIVEKMIKYGTKTLYSINFDNVGRRLLDPTLTEIKKA